MTLHCIYFHIFGLTAQYVIWSSIKYYTGKLLEAAQFNKDQPLLILLSSAHDLAASEAKYHRSCRDKYVSQYDRDSAKLEG